ncbi:MAG TPA: hypothetical protein VGR21_02730, partial [Cryptosporangiaceae bacterium]|nr:hypothetical protein [Cryptosporangiaceae bacterium]
MEGFAWVTADVFRKTVATLLDDVGLSARVVADQLGHAKPSMTQDVYVGRNMIDPRATAALDAMFPAPPKDETVRKPCFVGVATGDRTPVTCGDGSPDWTRTSNP